MGNFCDCIKAQEDETQKESLLTLGEDEEALESHRSERGAQYYQSIVDEAHKKFISSSSRHRIRTNNGAEELKGQLASASVDVSVFSEPSYRPTTGSVSRNRIVDVLSEPVDVSSIDVIADEIAELVSNHTFNFRMDDTVNATVVSFKPVVGTITSVN